MTNRSRKVNEEEEKRAMKNGGRGQLNIHVFQSVLQLKHTVLVPYLSEQHGGFRNAHIDEANDRVSVRRVIIAVDREVAGQWGGGVGNPVVGCWMSEWARKTEEKDREN
jgi:hypothetical protein